MMSASDAPSSMASASDAPSRMMLSTDDALSTVLSFCAARDLAPLRAASSRFVSLVEESVQRRLPLRCDARGCDLSMLDALEPRCWCPADAAALSRCCERALDGDWIALSGGRSYSCELACGRIMKKALRIFSRGRGYAVLESRSSRSLYVADASVLVEGLIFEAPIRAHGSRVRAVDCGLARTDVLCSSSVCELAGCWVPGDAAGAR